jgi:hypothetical protein
MCLRQQIPQMHALGAQVRELIDLSPVTHLHNQPKHCRASGRTCCQRGSCSCTQHVHSFQRIKHPRERVLPLPPACRNITITGAQGLDTVLDLAFLHGVVQLCTSCVFTITNITLTNERRGVCLAACRCAVSFSPSHTFGALVPLAACLLLP